MQKVKEYRRCRGELPPGEEGVIGAGAAPLFEPRRAFAHRLSRPAP